ncbi:MAG: diaminopimelate epimerase [Thermodesulfobacteriota bacterium]
MKFYKYHGLGNDYLVIHPEEVTIPLTTDRVQAICDRHYGVGSDGILLGPVELENLTYGVRIFNPDGSEAEKSGNGLRIFARHLWEQGLVDASPFTIITTGSSARATVRPGGNPVSVEMGRVSFRAEDIPFQGASGEVINKSKTVAGQDITYCAATIGNPHCVVLCDDISRDLAVTSGPLLENDRDFPNRANVQFIKIINRNTIALEVWERGAGYTLACGSAASVAAATARRLNLCDPEIAVLMPGGRLDIIVNKDYSVILTGPVTPIAEGVIRPEMFDSYSPEIEKQA